MGIVYLVILITSMFNHLMESILLFIILISLLLFISHKYYFGEFISYLNIKVINNVIYFILLLTYSNS